MQYSLERGLANPTELVRARAMSKTFKNKTGITKSSGVTSCCSGSVKWL
jgi:hypothetical protein